MKPIYLDYNATTPMAEGVADAMLPYLREHFGNPSSSHPYGVKTRSAVERARRQVAELLGCRPDEVIFTSGGSESNNFAIKGTAYANQDRGRHLITSRVEHPAVLEVCRHLEREGWRVTYVRVDGCGMVSVDEVRRALTPATILISVMHANNEVGTIQPIEKLAELARDRGLILHTDAAQSFGKIPVRVDELGADLISVAGHKIYAPKGVGALYCRRGLILEKLIDGAGHENGRRAGTENVLGIVGLGEACEMATRDEHQCSLRMRKMRDRLFERLQSRVPAIRLNGHPECRLPNTLSVGFPDLEAGALLSEMEKEVAASAGAACHEETIKVSSVLLAMKVPREYAMGTIRLSTGRMTTEDEIDHAVEAIDQAVTRLRRGKQGDSGQKQ